MPELHFTLDPDLLTWEDWEALEAAPDMLRSKKIAPLRGIMARFMVGADGQPMDYAEAMAILGKLKVKQIPDAITALTMAKVKAEGDIAELPPAPPGS